MKVSSKPYTNKYLDVVPMATSSRYQLPECKKHIGQASWNSAGGLFDVWLAQSIAQVLVADLNIEYGCLAGSVVRLSNLTYISPPLISCDLLYLKWNMINEDFELHLFSFCSLCL
jgi:hypothetical protein